MEKIRGMRAPLKYVQSKNSLLLFYNEMGYIGKRWLFICSNSGYRNCHDKIEQSFAGQDDIDVVVGVGGGAAIDTAKATAYYEGKRVISVPTVVATDAPCTGLSVIYNDDGSFDQYLFYPQNPDAVIVDTQVIANAPVKFLIDGMGDALGTYFEGLASLRTESPSLEGIGITRSGMALAKCCYDTLVDYGSQAVTACEHNVVTPALEAIVEANVYLSGVGADNVNCAGAHSFYNGVTSLGGHKASHGACVAFGTLVQLILEGAVKELFEEVQSFCLEVGLPVTLEELSLSCDDEEALRTIAENACAEGETIHNLAGDVTPDELYAAIIAADAMGKEAKQR